jgi:hypothetical protein
MGKSHKDVKFCSRSESKSASHNRDFGRHKKKTAHSSIRNSNRTSDECSYKNLRDTSSKYDMLKFYFGKPNHAENFTMNNLEHIREFSYTDKYLKENYDIKWEKGETQIDMLNKAIEENNAFHMDCLSSRHCDKPTSQKKNNAIQMCKKQIERRGNAGLFYSHR